MENKYNSFMKRALKSTGQSASYFVYFSYGHTLDTRKIYEHVYELQRRQQIKNPNENYYKATSTHTQYTKLFLVLYAQ